MELNRIYNEDCLEGMKRIPDGMIDMVLCDLPFGKLDNSWDKRLPFDKLWEQYRRITKRNSAIVLFANNLFEFELVNSAIDLFKYKWTWIKNTTSNFINCKNRPMTKHEDILIFSKGTAANCSKNNMTYNPQNLILHNKRYSNGKRKIGTIAGIRPCNKNYENHLREFTNYPTDILYFDTPTVNERFHSTQKPVDLLEYLIRTYTNEGELVLDNCIGNGSTAVAAINTNRNFIGFETEKEYFNIANRRIAEAQAAKER